VSEEAAAALQKDIDMFKSKIRSAMNRQSLLKDKTHRHRQAHENDGRKTDERRTKDGALVRDILDFENRLNSMPREAEDECVALVSSKIPLPALLYSPLLKSSPS
jgi:hypothetical protein